ncbi:hypothetical protein GF391_02225 [Candidatus Uhrbacteria bacterium]|nr:hypothetical protein [Candidatus Uhrbacteria bacterium]
MNEKSACEDTGGQLVNDDDIYPDCAGPTIGCCVAPICEDVTGSDSTEGSQSGSQAVPQTGSTENWSYGVPGGLRLVGCTNTGKCKLKDIVQQGIYVADFLIGLSGALFLIAFIWGGAMYLLSFGRSAWVEKGRNAMIKSAIGIVLIIMAWTIVTFVAESLGYTAL